MSLALSLDVVTPAPTTQEGLQVRVKLTHGDSSRGRGATGPLRLPGTDDCTDALTFRAYASSTSDSATWEANPRVRHLMMVAERRDRTEPFLELLSPGQTWTWELDLSSCQYPLPVGDHWVEAFYRYAPEGVDLRSGRVLVSVSESLVHDLRVTRDNCVIDGLQVLLKAEGDSGFEWIGRLYNAGHPLAAWYSGPIHAGATGAHVLAAYNAFQNDDVFDHFFDRWIVEIARDEARCHRIDGARVVRERMTSRLGGLHRWPRAAFWDGGSGLYLISTEAGGSLHCHRLVSGDAEPRFVHGSSFHLGTPAEVVVDAQHIHLAVQSRGLTYERLDRLGNVVLRRELPRSRYQPFGCRYDVDKKRVLATFWDGPNGRDVRFVALSVETGEVLSLERSLPLRNQRIRELSFDVDLAGRFHYLVGTSAQRLYYGRGEDVGPWLAASGEELFLPYVHTPRRVFLGFQQARHGWRFRLYAGRGLGGHLQPPDPPPPGGKRDDDRVELLGATTTQHSLSREIRISDADLDKTIEQDLGKTSVDLPQWEDDTVRASAVTIVDSSVDDTDRTTAVTIEADDEDDEPD